MSIFHFDAYILAFLNTTKKKSFFLLKCYVLSRSQLITRNLHKNVGFEPFCFHASFLLPGIFLPLEVARELAGHSIKKPLILINTKTHKKNLPVQSVTSLCYLQNENMSIKNLITRTKKVKKWITTFTQCTRKLKPIEWMNTEKEPAIGHNKCYKV